MTFLNPSVLFGLLAASIPIILHFLNLRKLKKVEFSTLAFLKELQKTKIRKLKLKQWLLLVLRILIIIFLVLSFARPTAKNVFLGSQKANSSAAFIIDNTFSMSVVANEGSYFNKSKQIARELLNNFSYKDEIVIIPSVIENNSDYKLKSDLNKIKEEIDELRISTIRKTLHGSIIKAAQLLYESKYFIKEIYIFTDRQQGSLFDSSNELSDFGDLFQGIKIYLINLNLKTASNLGIESFTPANQIFEKNKIIVLNATVKNYGNNDIKNSVASLFINGKRSAQQSLSIKRSESKILSFETTLTDTGFINPSIELEADDINHDNLAYTSFYVPSKINIAFLTEHEEDIRFIKFALESFVTEVFNKSNYSYAQLSTLQLEKYDLIIAIIPESNYQLNKLHQYLLNGGKAIFLPGAKSTESSLISFFSQLALPISTGLIGNINSEEDATRFETIDINHPIFYDLFEDKHKTKIESPEIYYYSRIIPKNYGTTIISMMDKSAFLSEYKIEKGKALMFNTAPVLSWNNLPLKSIFPSLINKCVLYLTSNSKEPESIFAGKELFVNISSLHQRQIKIVRPDGSPEFLNLEKNTQKNFINYNKTDQVGNYQFFAGNKLIDYFSVNIDPKESVVNYLTESDFTAYLKNIGISQEITTINEGNNYLKEIEKARIGQEFWKHFLFAALILALLEMLIARNTRKETLAVSEN